MQLTKTAAIKFSLRTSRFHCLLQDRTADAKLTKEGIFGNPRGGFLYIRRIFDALKLLLPEDETSAKRGTIWETPTCCFVFKLTIYLE
jgi:hypothetical protein